MAAATPRATQGPRFWCKVESYRQVGPARLRCGVEGRTGEKPMLIGQAGRTAGETGTAGRRAHRRRWATLGAVLVAALAAMTLGASAAQAEEPTDTIEWGCKVVTINYSGFPSGEAVT